MTTSTLHPSQTPEYWEEHARNERRAAQQKRSERWASVESIKIHLCNAEEYEATARRLRAEAA